MVFKLIDNQRILLCIGKGSPNPTNTKTRAGNSTKSLRKYIHIYIQINKIKLVGDLKHKGQELIV